MSSGFATWSPCRVVIAAVFILVISVGAVIVARLSIDGEAKTAFDTIKAFLDCVAGVAALFVGVAAIYTFWLAVRTYRENADRERAKWLGSLYEKFYDNDRYKKVRGDLDVDANPQFVESELVDYLNFFEFAVHLIKSDQLRGDDVLALFDYWLRCLLRHDTILKYIHTNGFETLDSYLTALAKRTEKPPA
jgi:hypothetical protein